MSRLPLTYVVSCATLQLLARVLRNKLVPRPFRALHKKFWFTYNIDKRGNSSLKHFEHNLEIRSNL